MKYSIVEYPIPEDIIKSGLISQTNLTARINNSNNKCIVSYANAYMPSMKGYSALSIEELNSYIMKDSKEWDAEFKKPDESVVIQSAPPFASKKFIDVDGVEKSLFKRVHGVESAVIQPGATGYIEFAVPWNVSKFSGAQLINVEMGDKLDFFVLDTDTNLYSGAPIAYPNWLLNQFGFNVCMPNEKYENTSNYDASLFKSMLVSCAYKNNSDKEKIIYMNVELHEVKK